jgi:GNAT superfamily N-acetyltransferase
MHIIIREAVEKDYPAIIATLKEFAIFQKTPPEKVTNTPELMKEEKDFFKCYIAEDEEGSFMGMATYSFVYYTWSGKSLYLDDLYVKQEYRKLKVGKSLLNKIFEIAKQARCKRVRWLVSNWNTNAIDFYVKCGASIHKEEYVCDVDEAGIDKYFERILIS